MRARFGPRMLSKRLSSQNSHLMSMDYLCTLPSACSLSCPHKWQKLFQTPLSPKNIQSHGIGNKPMSAKDRAARNSRAPFSPLCMAWELTKKDRGAKTNASKLYISIYI
uniref:Uncharacterized protein n=1 Tax=Sphaerodactylus townsendi TaxID=933632 RepID=A0ACB8FHG8_9SAUR